MLNGSLNAYECVDTPQATSSQMQAASQSSSTSSPRVPTHLSIDLESGATESEYGPQRGRSQSLRRQSISLNAVLNNHRRALFGALFTRVGSNMSLPSCVQDQEALSMELNEASISSSSKSNRPVDPESTSRPILLQLTSATPIVNVNGAAATAVHNLPLANLNLDKDKSRNSFTGAGSGPDDPSGGHAKQQQQQRHTRLRQQQAQLMSSISTLYAKLLVVVGVAVPVTASVSQQVPAALDQGFYLYLYLGSVAFVVAIYTTLLRDKALKKMIVKHVRHESTYSFVESQQLHQKKEQVESTAIEINCKCGQLAMAERMQRQQRAAEPALGQPYRTQQYGSFCLRLGAVGFGAGSLVFTGLQIGAELSNGPFRALIPASRLLLVTAQMHFIFLNSKDLELTRHAAFAKLGLMHLIATNICEWLQALVEETQYEMEQLEHSLERDNSIFIKLLRDASPFLFPCTIEFSLICAVILFEMWKRIDQRKHAEANAHLIGGRSVHQLSIDCGSAHRGLFGGILVVAATVLSLIMFFVLRETNPQMAIEQVTSLEAAIQTAGMIASVGGALKLRSLDHRNTKPPHLDSTLLTAAQAGVYLHCIFGAVGSILTRGPTWIICLAANFLALLQSTTQTILIQIAWRRRSRSNEKPGKELITFLIVVNIAMWAVNSLEKSRAGVRPDHLEFFGIWAWTIITHLSIPLAIFYRFHSAICLFEVWKSCYKYRPLLLGSPLSHHIK
ncbi:uncharacterized protein LOC106657895 isoform X1 [Trichogramma pretiosum]|uniref:uncharacterized protein LOC106657895 isoform X1 n=2 Tax=Trichogramma pretiosum TaxID=7493 RepID=UPI0006C945D1|nr:uncharacterized protein LOC106657895 isoform X1 [Trichogramma pretiosum]